MSADYSGTSVPTLNNSPASSWNTDAAKKSHVNDLYLVTGSGASAGNLYAFEEYAKPLVKNATPGEIVTFTDGGDNAPITSASVAISPIQSLNGYDSPWPGGGGKNKIPSQTVNKYGNNYFVAGTSSEHPIALKAGTYTFSNEGVSAYAYWQKQGTTDNNVIHNGATNAGTFTITEDANYKIWFYQVNVTESDFYNIQLEIGSSATAYEPYANICPISGHTGAELYVAAEYDAEDKTTYSVTFPETIYGGSHEFVSGKAAATMAKYTITGANIAAYHKEGNLWRITITGINYGTNNNYKNGLCDCYTVQTSYGGVNSNNNSIGFNSSDSTQILIRDDTFTTTNIRDLLNANPLEVVYPLATPLEYTLSPQQLTTLQGQNNVWSDAGPITQLTYTSNQFTPSFSWFETWTVPKITRDNGQVIVLPKPQEYTPEIYDVDAATTGRNAAGAMIRDRVARKHKFNYKFAALSQQDATEILNAVQDVSFTLTTASPETGAKTNYRVYVGDRSMPIYWMPTHAKASWMYSSLSLNLIEM